MTVEALPDLELVEQLDDAPACEGTRDHKCDSPAVWLETATCDTPGCPDEHYFYCQACADYWRADDRDTEPCAWCKLTDLVLHWERL